MHSIKFQVPAFEVALYPFCNTSVEIQKLFSHAIHARKKGDQPISKFHVGSAIQVQGCEKPIYIGANCENVNFNGSTHAEQCAINAALMEKTDNAYGSMHIKNIAVVGGMHNTDYDKIKEMTMETLSSLFQSKSLEEIMDSFCTPCGHCRQIIAPYSNENTKVYLLNQEGIVSQIPFKNLLPFPFKEIK